MKKFYIFLVSSLFVLTAFAQSKLDQEGRRILAERKIERALLEKGKIKKLSFSADDKILSMVRFDDEKALGELVEKGAEIVNRIGDMAILRVRVDDMLDLSETKGVIGMGTSKLAEISNVAARAVSQVDAVHQGSGIDQAYDGTGVVVGMMDTGMDPNHLAFLDAEGVSRVRGFSLITGSSGNKVSTTDPDEIADITTEKEGASHGTHVTGILAGGYDDENNHFYGVAPKADIYMSCGDTYDYNILLGVQDVCKYGYDNGKPSVVNISLGSNIGSHDANDYCPRYLDLISGSYNSIICVSAGNEGSIDCAITHNFTEEQPVVKTIYNNDAGDGINMIGQIDLWSKDDSAFSTTFVIVDSDGEIIFQLPKVEGPIDNTIWFASSNYAESIQSSYPYDIVVTSDEFDNLYSGYGYIDAAIPENENRFNAYVYLNLQGNAAASDCRPAFIIEGNAGQTVYGYTNPKRGYFTSCGIEGFIDGSDNGSINVLACGKKTVSVGSYCSKRDFIGLDGNEYSYGFTDNGIVYYSSYGEIADGRLLPTIVAPGSAINSAYSSYYVPYMGSSKDVYCTAKTNYKGQDYYWGIMNGTSMASPHAAGIMALWKQAYPDLTPEDAIEIAQATATHDSFTEDAGLQAGGGKINALLGIKSVIELRDGVEGIIADKNDHVIMSNVSRGEFDIAVAGENKIDVKVYNLAGQLVSSTPSIDGKAHVVVPAYSGVFVVSVNGQKAVYNRKVVIK